MCLEYYSYSGFRSFRTPAPSKVRVLLAQPRPPLSWALGTKRSELSTRIESVSGCLAWNRFNPSGAARQGQHPKAACIPGKPGDHTMTHGAREPHQRWALFHGKVRKESGKNQHLGLTQQKSAKVRQDGSTKMKSLSLRYKARPRTRGPCLSSAHLHHLLCFIGQAVLLLGRTTHTESSQ